MASVTHELKTPVASIRLLAETLRMNPAPDAAAAAPLLDEIREQADRQSRLIDNVLGVARIDRGLTMYRPADVDLAAAVDQVLGELDYLLRQEGFVVHRTVADGAVRVSADADGLRQAITNLVTNAVKYSGRCRELRIAIDRAGSDVRLQITDGGIGIEQSEQRKIFERFDGSLPPRAKPAVRPGTRAGPSFRRKPWRQRDGRESYGAREHVDAPPRGGRQRRRHGRAGCQ